MKIPSLRANIGTWTYYVSTLSFQQINDYVEKIDDQLHKSEGLKDLIQRSITNNFLNIKDYIINQPEMFFNSIVLAVYNGNPKWIEVELAYGDEEYFNMGFLDFPEQDAKIFPVDGQHRVEGIKAALESNPELANNKIGVIFIGHSVTDEGMQKSRRLFTTLNRYAKPVTMDDIIALDEDDSIAIVTRNLLENFSLFTDKKVTISKNKSIQENDKNSITSIITLYQCNKELLKLFRHKRKLEDPNPIRDNKSFEEYLKFRPNTLELELFDAFCVSFWTKFSSEFTAVNTFLSSTEERPALQFRNRENGGNLIFRPVGLLPLIQAAVEVHKRQNTDFSEVFSKFNRIDFNLNQTPWKLVLWNPFENSMIMGSSGVVKLLLMYMYGNGVIRPSELTSLKNKYAAKINFEDENIETVLENIVVLE